MRKSPFNIKLTHFKPKLFRFSSKSPRLASGQSRGIGPTLGDSKTTERVAQVFGKTDTESIFQRIHEKIDAITEIISHAAKATRRPSIPRHSTALSRQSLWFLQKTFRYRWEASSFSTGDFRYRRWGFQKHVKTQDIDGKFIGFCGKRAAFIKKFRHNSFSIPVSDTGFR